MAFVLICRHGYHYQVITQNKRHKMQVLYACMYVRVCVCVCVCVCVYMCYIHVYVYCVHMRYDANLKESDSGT